jgi:hypothetical protein
VNKKNAVRSPGLSSAVEGAWCMLLRYSTDVLFFVFPAYPLASLRGHVAGQQSHGLWQWFFAHYSEGPRFCRGMNAPSATGCRHSLFLLIEQKEFFGAADSCRRGSTFQELIVHMMFQNQ